MSSGIGLDIGTNMLVSARLSEDDGNPYYRKQRDAFFRISPKSSINKKSIQMSLESRRSNFIVEGDDFIVVGEDALYMANERNMTARRPMSKGVLSSKEKDSLPIIKLIIKSLVEHPKEDTEKLVFSIPAEPVDGEFDIFYHQEMMKSYLREMGFDPEPLNESFAIAFSELLDDGLTGVCVSCLVPGTKVYTNNGIVDIEDVKENDKVITHKGRYRNVNKVITKNFKGVATKIQLEGYINNTNNYKFVDNHEIFVYRGGDWRWVGCEDVVEGDIVGEPIIKQDLTNKIISMTICERITSSNEYTKKTMTVSPDVQRLIGYFLGDGSICERESGIQFDFGINEKDNIKDVINILNKNFGKASTVYEKSDNCIRIKCYSKGMASWFRNHCYNDDKEKIYPWDISKLNRSSCLSLLAGLLRSDGCIGAEQMVFYNTNTKLILLCKQLFSKLGIAASISFREPRNNFLKSENRFINGKKVEWSISTGKKEVFISLVESINTINCENSRYADRIFINDGFCCSRIQKIDYEGYEGVVYDLQIEEDHSFSGPFLTIHNCGAGMINSMVCYEGDPIVQFSLTRGGDWIDNSVGKALDMSPSLVQLEKEESGLDLTSPQDKIQEALGVYYNVLINYALDNIVYELGKSKLPSFREPIPVIVSGGLTLVDGFAQKFEKESQGKKFPFDIREVRRANDPMNCVAHGCLMAAIL